MGDLKAGVILVECDKTNHNDCNDIRNALIESSKDIRQAVTINSIFDDKHYCVLTTVLVDADLVDDLKNLFLNTAVGNVKVKYIKTII